MPSFRQLHMRRLLSSPGVASSLGTSAQNDPAQFAAFSASVFRMRAHAQARKVARDKAREQEAAKTREELRKQRREKEKAKDKKQDKDKGEK